MADLAINSLEMEISGSERSQPRAVNRRSMTVLAQRSWPLAEQIQSYSARSGQMTILSEGQRPSREGEQFGSGSGGQA